MATKIDSNKTGEIKKIEKNTYEAVILIYLEITIIIKNGRRSFNAYRR